MRRRAGLVLVLSLAACNGEPAAPLGPPKQQVDLEPAVANAIARARDARDASPDAATWGHLARVLHAHRMFREAADTYAESAKLPGCDRFESAYLRGICLEDSDPETAAALFDEANALRAGYVPLLLRIGILKERMGESAHARTLFQKAEATRSTLQGRLALARTWLVDGEAERAFEILQSGGDDSRQWLEALARACYATGRDEPARRAAAAGATAPNTAPVDDPVLARVLTLGASFSHHLARAQERFGAGELVAALGDVERALAVRPEQIDALGLRGRVLARLDRPAEAVTAFETALALRPDDAELLVGMGVQLERLQRTDEASGAFDRALDAEPGRADALLGKARLLGKTDPGAAQETVVRVLRTDPTNPLAQRALANLLIRGGDFDKGTRYLQDASAARRDTERARAALENAVGR